MKRLLLFCCSFFIATIFADDTPLKVLMIGNSFSMSCKTYLRAVSSSANCKLDLEIAYIGGCSLQRHVNEYAKSESTPTHRPYRSITNQPVSLQELLSQKKWDIISIQQASHFSWRQETYHPWAEQLIDIIRKTNPQAEIVIQETWSYNGGDPRFAPAPKKSKVGKSWDVNQSTMFTELDKCYRDLAKTYQFRIVPVGVAVQLSRADSPRQLPTCDAQYLNSLVHPDGLPETLDVVGRCFWKKNADGKMVASADTIHLNAYGQYLQACVWFGFLFKKPVSDITLYPKNLDRERLEKLRKIAQDALNQNTPAWL